MDNKENLGSFFDSDSDAEFNLDNPPAEEIIEEQVVSTEQRPKQAIPEKKPVTYDSQVERLIDISAQCRSEARDLRSLLFANGGDSDKADKGGLFSKPKKSDTSPQILSDAMAIAIETLESASEILIDLSRDVRAKLGNRRL